MTRQHLPRHVRHDGESVRVAAGWATSTTQRKGDGFSVHAVEEGGGQPGLRFYDEADRDRNRVSLLATLMASDKADVTAQVAYGKDTYGGPGARVRAARCQRRRPSTSGVNVYPMETVTFGVNYGRDNFESMQKSRNANPAPDPSWTDPSRDWYLDNDETVNNFDIYLDVLKAIEKTDIRFNYTFSRLGQRVPALRAAHRHAAGGGPVRGAAERDQQVAAAPGRPAVLRYREDRLRGRVLVREARRHRLRHHQPATAPTSRGSTTWAA